jgi:hypothetical protein
MRIDPQTTGILLTCIECIFTRSICKLWIRFKWRLDNSRSYREIKLLIWSRKAIYIKYMGAYDKWWTSDIWESFAAHL